MEARSKPRPVMPLRVCPGKRATRPAKRAGSICVGIVLAALFCSEAAPIPEGLLDVVTDLRDGIVELQYDGSGLAYEMEPGATGKVRIRTQGGRQRGMPGEPVLPVFHLRIGFPPDVDPDSVTVGILDSSYQELPDPVLLKIGEEPEVDVPPDEEPPKAFRMIRPHLDQWSRPDGFYPAQPFRIEAISGMRKWVYADCVLYPFTYNVDTHRVEQLTSLTARIHFTRTGVPPGNLARDRAADRRASGMLLNFDALKDIYGWDDGSPVRDVLAIVTRSAIVAADSGISEYAAWLNSADLPTIVVDDTDYGMYAGATPSEQARNWLIDHYQDEGILYVLLIGDPRTDGAGDIVTDYSLPMLEIYYNGGTDVSPNRGHTDRWFADLNSGHNWDLDGDGQYGEWVGDYLPDAASIALAIGGLRLADDVYVGRIPIYGDSSDDLEELRVYFNSIKWFMCWQNEFLWRSRAVFAGALLRFYDERRGDTCCCECNDKADGSVMGEMIADDFWAPRGYDVVKYYQYGDNLGSPYVGNTYYDYSACASSPPEYTMTYCQHPGDESLGFSNLVERVRNESQSLLFWCGHGGTSGSSLYLWTDLDEDGIPEDGTCGDGDGSGQTDEVTSSRFILRDDVTDSGYPARNQRFFAYMASCSNGRISYGGSYSANIAEEMLRKYASAVVAGTAAMWLTKDEDFIPDGYMVQEIGYRLADHVTQTPVFGSSRPMTFGRAFFEATDSGWRVEETDLGNILHFNLLGDPRLRLRYNLSDWDGTAVQVIPLDQWGQRRDEMYRFRDDVLRHYPRGRGIIDIVYRNTFELGVMIGLDPPLGAVVWDAVEPILGISMDFLDKLVGPDQLAMPPAVKTKIMTAINRIGENASGPFQEDLGFIRDTVLRLEGLTFEEVAHLFGLAVRIRKKPAGIELRWPSKPGTQYTIQRTTDLGAEWLDLGTFTAEGDEMVHPDDPPAADTVFYRIVQ